MERSYGGDENFVCQAFNHCEGHKVCQRTEPRFVKKNKGRDRLERSQSQF